MKLTEEDMKTVITKEETVKKLVELQNQIKVWSIASSCTLSHVVLPAIITICWHFQYAYVYI